MTGFGGMVSFELDGTVEEVVSFVSSRRFFALGESLGRAQVGRDGVDPGQPGGAELNDLRGACDVVRAGARAGAPADAGQARHGD